MSASLSARSVTNTFGKGELAVRALNNVSLDIEPGEITLLMGPSGSGKTTLISALVGILPISSGDVYLCGHRVSAMTKAAVAALRRSHVGFVFQAPNLFPALTAFDNVSEVLRLRGMSSKDARRAAQWALDSVGLSERYHHRPAQLSGGQRQRVAIARSIAGSPKVIVGDEVTSALDGQAAALVMQMLRAQVGPNTAVLLVTHDRRLEAFAERVVVLEDGAIVRDDRLVAPKC